MQLRIVTYNIRHCRGMDGKVDLERITQTLEGFAPDLICLQEVDYLNPRSRWAKQAARIADGLGMRHAYGNNLALGPFTGMGNAILSKWSIYSTWNKHLLSMGERRGLIHAALEIEGTSVDVFCSHWGLSVDQRARQAEECAGAVNQVNGPVVFCGDLNATPGSGEIDELRSAAALASAGDDQELTFTSDRPYAKIDYILVSDRIKVLQAGPKQSLASDHLPFLADLEI